MCLLHKSLPGGSPPPAPLSQQNTYKMNKQISILAITVFITLFATTLGAQQNIVKIRPLPILGKFGFQYERKIAGHSSIEVEWQRWNFQRKKSDSFFLLGLLYTSSSSDVIQVKGNRFQVVGRCYEHKNMTGWFFEGGFHVGKFDIKRTESSSSFSVLGFFTGDFGSESTKITRYDNVRAKGLKAGGGFQKKYGRLFVNLSGGLEFNELDTKAAALVRGLRPVTPYGRFAIGVGF